MKLKSGLTFERALALLNKLAEYVDEVDYELEDGSACCLYFIVNWSVEVEEIIEEMVEDIDKALDQENLDYDPLVLIETPDGELIDILNLWGAIEHKFGKHLYYNSRKNIFTEEEKIIAEGKNIC